MKILTSTLIALALLPSLAALAQDKEAPARPLTLEQKLETAVNLNFDETPLRDALNFLSQFSNTPIFIDPEVFQQRSQDELMVTLRANDITIRNALDLVTLTKTLAWDIRWGGVFLSTESRLKLVRKSVPHFFPTAEDRALLKRLYEPITYSFDGAAVPEILGFIRTLKSLNIVIDDAIKSRADEIASTQSISNLPVRDALCALLLPNGLTWEVNQGVVFVRGHLGAKEPTWHSAAGEILDRTRVGAAIEGTTLGEAVDALHAKSPVEIHLDPALRFNGLAGKPPAPLEATDITLRSAVNLLTKTNSLAWDLRWGGVYLTTPERQAAMPKTPLSPPARGAPAWEAKLRERLNKPVSFAFDAVEMSEALDFLRNLRSLNVVVHPKARGKVESTRFNLRVTDLRLEFALAHILFPHGLRFELTDEVVLITKAE